MLLWDAKTATKKRIRKGRENLRVNLATRTMGIETNATLETTVVNSLKREIAHSILKQIIIGRIVSGTKRGTTINPITN